MKIYLKITSIITALFLILSVFASCAENAGDSNASDSDISDTVYEAEASEKADEDSLPESESEENSSEENTAKEASSSSSKESATEKTAEKATEKSTEKPTAGKPTAPTEAEKPAAGGYKVETLYCANGAKNLYGEVYIPNNIKGNAPAVILAHSYMLTGDSLAAYAKMVAEKGFVAYIFDFWGGSNGSRSGGTTKQMTVYTEISDLEAVIAKIRGLSYVDKNNIFVLGTSLGGCVSALTANDNPSLIKGLILLYPALISQEQAKSWSSMAGSFGINWMKNLAEFNVFDRIGNFKGDVLIIHGTMDTQVPLKFSQQAVEVYQSAKLVTLTGQPHNFSTSNKTANSNIMKFLEEHT